LLVQNAPKGLPAGEIARRLKLPGLTLSFHLNILAETQLIEPQRNGRSISYSRNFQNVNRLMNKEKILSGQSTARLKTKSGEPRGIEQ